MFPIHIGNFLRSMSQRKIVFQNLVFPGFAKADLYGLLMCFCQPGKIQIQVGQLVALRTVYAGIGRHQVPKQIMRNKTPGNEVVQIIMAGH